MAGTFESGIGLAPLLRATGKAVLSGEPVDIQFITEIKPYTNVSMAQVCLCNSRI